jgi:hypothetical protein
MYKRKIYKKVQKFKVALPSTFRTLRDPTLVRTPNAPSYLCGTLFGLQTVQLVLLHVPDGVPLPSVVTLVEYHG